MPLVADLGRQVRMPPCTVHHQLGLMEGTAHRFLDIDVLALVQREHRDGEMGMVRNRSCDSLELVAALVEHLAVVTEPLGFGVHRQDLLALRAVDVDVTECDDIDHPRLGEVIDDLLSPVADSDEGDLDFLSPGLGLGQTSGESVLAQNLTWSQGHAGRSDRHGLEEISSVKHIVDC